jgi:hypothetical protein
MAPRNTQMYTLYLTRPFTVLATSLWEYWYRSSQFKEVAGFSMTNGIFVGTPIQSTSTAGVLSKQEYTVRCYRLTTELERMKSVLEELVNREPARALQLLESAWGIYEAEIAMQSKAPKDIEKLRANLQFEYQDIEELFDTYVSIGIYTTVLPYFWLGKSNSKHKEHARIEELCQKLRATTLYPSFFEQVVLPYLEGKTGLSRTELNFFTWNEILALSKEVDALVYFKEAAEKRKMMI